MSDIMLARRSPVADLARPGRYGAPGEPGASLREVVPATLLALSVHGAGNDTLALPAAGTFTVSGSGIIAWVGPGQYLAFEFGEGSGLLPQDGKGISATDLSGSRLMLRVSGPQAREGLSKLVPVDLHPDAFTTGRSAPTVIAHMPVLVLQTDASPTYLLICYRSFGRSLWRTVTAALTPQGYTIDGSFSGY